MVVGEKKDKQESDNIAKKKRKTTVNSPLLSAACLRC
jgi:hypothetical protein